MSSFKARLLVAAMIAGLAVIGSLMNSQQVAAQGPPGGMAVNIVKSIPLEVTGSTTISGTVAATQSGAWNVGISGAPNVQVMNTANAPVPVRDVENPVRQPFQANGACDMGSFASCEFNLTFPGGKLLVIETVSAEVNVQPGQKPFALMTTVQNGSTTRYDLPLQPMASFNGLDFYNALHLVRLYAAPGTTVTVIGERASGGGDAGIQASISGYLLDCGSSTATAPCPLP